MTGTTIFHLQFKTGGDHYFGSIAAIYDVFKSDAIGISQQGLYNYKIVPVRPYANKICTIRKGMLIRKKGNRKLPKSE